MLTVTATTTCAGLYCMWWRPGTALSCCALKAIACGSIADTSLEQSHIAGGSRLSYGRLSRAFLAGSLVELENAVHLGLRAQLSRAQWKPRMRATGRAKGGPAVGACRFRSLESGENDLLVTCKSLPMMSASLGPLRTAQTWRKNVESNSADP